jgi:hypothetical protein
VLRRCNQYRQKHYDLLHISYDNANVKKIEIMNETVN